jgi:hypothetical protein
MREGLAAFKRMGERLGQERLGQERLALGKEDREGSSARLGSPVKAKRPAAGLSPPPVS